MLITSTVSHIPFSIDKPVPQVGWTKSVNDLEHLHSYMKPTSSILTNEILTDIPTGNENVNVPKGFEIVVDVAAQAASQ